MTNLAERKAFAIAAINALPNTNDMTMRHIEAIRAIAGLMPCDDADGAIESIADDLAHGVRVAVEYADPDAAEWRRADYCHEMQLCDVRHTATGVVA